MIIYHSKPRICGQCVICFIRSVCGPSWINYIEIDCGSNGKKICLQCRRPGFDPWVRKFLWRREWQSTQVFLPGELHGQRSPVGYSPWGRKESDTTEQLTYIHTKPRVWGKCVICFIRSGYGPSWINHIEIRRLVASFILMLSK